MAVQAAKVRPKTALKMEEMDDKMWQDMTRFFALRISRLTKRCRSHKRLKDFLHLMYFSCPYFKVLFLQMWVSLVSAGNLFRFSPRVHAAALFRWWRIRERSSSSSRRNCPSHPVGTRPVEEKDQLEVSWNGGTPRSSHFSRILSFINHPFGVSLFMETPNWKNLKVQRMHLPSG